MIGVGALTTGAIAQVDEFGRVTVDNLQLGWRVHVVDHWIDPVSERVVRHDRPGVAPTAETAVRVPGGEAIQRVYALGDAHGLVVVEVENASPDAIGVGFTLEGGDASELLAFPRNPGAVDGGVVVFPLPHRQTVRVALGDPNVDVRTLPDAATVERGWDAMLDRGMRVEIPAAELWAVDSARVDALLAAPSGAAFLALEEWGFDDEAERMWARLSSRERRVARKRAADTGVLGTTRAALMRERGPELDLVPGFRTQWLGQNIAVLHAPLREGELSFAIRWHGARPALLWEAPPGSVVRAPALDPSWSTTEATGETLLAEPPPALLPMGERANPDDGSGIDVPESFS